MASYFKNQNISELDSSNDIFGETPDNSPQVRLNFRQPLNSKKTDANHVHVEETPESSPLVEPTSGMVPSRRIPSDPTDSGISDSGTKSKSVTPESRQLTPHSRFVTPRSPDSRLMTPLTAPSAHRSPKVVYASDSDEASEHEGEFLSDDEDDESRQDVLTDDESEDERVVAVTDDEESMLVAANKVVASDDSSDDDVPLVKIKSKGEKMKQRQIVSSDDDDESFSQEITRKYPQPGEKPKSRQIISSDEDENFSQEIKRKHQQPVERRGSSFSVSVDEQKESDLSGHVKRKAALRIESSSDEFESAPATPQAAPPTINESIVLTPPPWRAGSPPTPPSGYDDRDTSHSIPKNATSRYNSGSEAVKHKDSDVVTVSSDEEDIVVVAETTNKTKYGEKDIKELEDEIRRLKNSILMNNNMVNTSGRRLPDGGASIRATIQQDAIRMQKLQETLGQARKEIFKASGGVFEPQRPSMMKQISGSRLGATTSATSLNRNISGSGLYRNTSGSSLGRNVSGSSLPAIQNSPKSQLDMVRKKKSEFENLLKFSSRLSDGGDILRQKIEQADKDILALEKQLSDQLTIKNSPPHDVYELPQENSHSNHAYQQLKQSLMSSLQSNSAASIGEVFGTGIQHNLYGGRMTNSRQREVKNVTHEAMEKMHKSLESMPAEGDMEDQPARLKSNITLFPHQKQALAWLLWREHQSTAPGGILADDMGLGKTLTMISLILKQNEIEDQLESEVDKNKENTWMMKGGGNLIKTRTTLIICPASLLGQWDNEIKNKVKSGTLKALVYHGAKARNATAREMSRYDVIITTYGVILSEVKNELGDAFKEPKKLDQMTAADEIDAKKGKLLSLAFQRIILDEAHQIRNPKSLQSQAVCKLRARRRWCVTGTPVQNKELDLYSLIRFLRCSPFDEYLVWKRWVENKSSQSIDRMNQLVKGLVLRRTKEQKSALTGKVLVDLPDKNTKLHQITLTEGEQEVYTEVEKFARGALRKFMDQTEENEERKEMGLGGAAAGGPGFSIKGGTNSEFAFNPYQDDDEKVKTHHLLTLLLRMRQICCHPGLIKGMLDQETKEAEGIIEEDGEDLDLLSKLEDMTINKESKEPSPAKILQMENPVFKDASASSKISTVVEELQKLKDKGIEEGIIEKAVVVSQWTSMLNIVKYHVKEQGLKFAEITGQVNIATRSEIVESFNQSQRGPQIMLLSLSAGGVGLNLVGANHLFLLDAHWNPQLEAQACDRIYRVGQVKDVYIHKFMVADTVEQRIFDLQKKKLKLADDVLSGAKKRSANNLSLDDLKSLFGLSEAKK